MDLGLEMTDLAAANYEDFFIADLPRENEGATTLNVFVFTHCERN